MRENLSILSIFLFKIRFFDNYRQDMVDVGCAGGVAGARSSRHEEIIAGYVE